MSLEGSELTEQRVLVIAHMEWLRREHFDRFDGGHRFVAQPLLASTIKCMRAGKVRLSESLNSIMMVLAACTWS